MDFDKIIDRLEALAEEYHEAAPKELLQNLSGTVEVCADELDMHFIAGIDRATELVREMQYEQNA